MKTLYTAVSTAQGGRDGHVASDDRVINMSLDTPEGLGGKGGSGTNPEQLFSAGYAACFDGALNLMATQKKIDAGQTEVTANVSIGKQSDGLGLAVQLDVLVPGVDQETAEGLVEAAHQFCPYSKATRGNIDVTLNTRTK
ncbi:Ohr subfamily peroxiredoxin [Scopulibacillus darangshiensis]|uniref:Ohr subfamily peroxiredoxin n=1 Tax=Scopulibacillus darangshiensis TaxID=442528 RepID=A0A4R2PAW5_9BACL|nr:organic hydroperoxide resistance protein [Scopulibacillus darangshiensis]TCP32230.1 Ohr subfamily peroxiredoxin [Scopulibacillus darangshiensis]